MEQKAPICKQDPIKRKEKYKPGLKEAALPNKNFYKGRKNRRSIITFIKIYFNEKDLDSADSYYDLCGNESK
jgi:hypothetical protein